MKTPFLVPKKGALQSLGNHFWFYGYTGQILDLFSEIVSYEHASLTGQLVNDSNDFLMVLLHHSIPTVLVVILF